MGGVRNIPSFSQAQAYARSARRLRAKWKDQPARLHRELRQLPMEKTAPAAPAAYSAENGRHTVYAEMVGKSLERGLLRYSARLRLIAAAAKLGIERFDANLIIAAVQNRARPRAMARYSKRTWRMSHFPTIAVLAVIQAAVMLACAWFWKG